MDEFHLYLMNNQPQNPQKYVVIDSDEQQQIQTNTPSTLSPFYNKTLSNLDSNLPQSNIISDDGTINKYIKSRKIEKTKTDSLKLEVSKIEAECLVLQKLIQGVAKREAQLKVIKHNIMRSFGAKGLKESKNSYIPFGEQKRQQKKSSRMKQESINSFTSSFDIGKTIKAKSSKIR